jgi:hypothetical protein
MGSLTREGTESTEENHVRSVAPLGFAQDGREIPATQSEALLNVAGYGYFGAGPGNAILSGENPHGTGVIIDEECAASEGPVRIDDPAGNCDLLAGVAARITVDLGDAFSRRTASQQQDSQGE